MAADTGNDRVEWSWDEHVLAFDLYMSNPRSPPSKDSTEVAELSQLLNERGRQHGIPMAEKFRNANGVYMKMMNFRRLDPSFLDQGKSGLSRGSKGEVEVWHRYSGDPAGLRQAAAEIRENLTGNRALATNGATDQKLSDGLLDTSPRIFASSVWGMDFERWGAWGFTDKGTRDRLAREIRPNDFVLSVGTMGEETHPDQRGRLLALMRIGDQQIETRSLVEPGLYEEHIRRAGVDPWPFGFPIKSAEAFEGGPLRSKVLPRISDMNLHRVMARHFVELTTEEVERVLALPRRPVPHIYSSPRVAFAARLRKRSAGPRPSLKPRTLSPHSGPAATYLMSLSGTAFPHVASRVTSPGQSIFKVGFSNDPMRRQRELNAYLPCEHSLTWACEREQWHDDEINAWAMEQEIFRLLGEAGTNLFKGEMVATYRSTIDQFWSTALITAQRPLSPPTVLET